MAKGNLEMIPETEKLSGADSAIQHEDAALKTAFRYFSEELLPYFGIMKRLWEDEKI